MHMFLYCSTSSTSMFQAGCLHSDFITVAIKQRQLLHDVAGLGVGAKIKGSPKCG